MSSSILWAEFAATYVRTRSAHREHELAKAELKKLVSEMLPRRHPATASGPGAPNSARSALICNKRAVAMHSYATVNRSANSPPPPLRAQSE